MYIFQLHNAGENAQIAIRPGSINRVETACIDGRQFAEIFFRVGRDDEHSVIIEHSVQEVVDAINKNSDYF